MLISQLNGVWSLYTTDGKIRLDANVPGSLYSALLENKIIEDPYYRLNQYDAMQYSETDAVYEHNFIADKKMLDCAKKYLRFDGIDTIADVYLNDVLLGSTENMHRIYEFEVSENLREGSNCLKVHIHSPVQYIKGKNAVRELWGVSSTMAGYPHIRKAHYMFGWDWGPQLPDMSIWRDVSLIGVNSGRIENVHVRQYHSRDNVRLEFNLKLSEMLSANMHAEICIISPEGTRSMINSLVTDKNVKMECVIPNPLLWNVRGYGKPNLYSVRVRLTDGGNEIDTRNFRIGLRTIELCREEDIFGEEFCFKVNGTKIFAMGANYIPEDQIISRCSAERTEKLLKDCAAANYNMIRVWGGGYYPDDYFYELCDEMGMLVWQDMMFACSVYDGTNVNFCSNVRNELVDNIKRIRNHPCLALWCGNNEIESAWQYWGLPENEELKKGYLRMFEMLAPKVVKQYDPDTAYWPSSPSSGGGFNDSGAMNKGDIHYWDVWHGLKPFTEYKKYLFRFCSEYGFESLPCMKTVNSFALKNDLNLMSPVMEAHQKCENGNEKLMYYIAQMVHYPYSFEALVYASQLVQADAVRLNVEQMRRHRGVCMGSLYWQVNDSNPVISWSSIDYFGRWKALHYYAKKFYAQVLCSIDDSNKKGLVVSVSNEKGSEFNGIVKWRVRRNTTEIVSEGQCEVNVPALSAADCFALTSEMTGIDEKMHNSCYIEYTLLHNSAIISDSTYLYCLPKQFEFINPEITYKVDKIGNMYRFCFSSKAFAKGVYLDYDEVDCVFSDNWFDMHGKDVYILAACDQFPPQYTINDITEKLRIRSYYDLASPENYR